MIENQNFIISLMRRFCSSKILGCFILLFLLFSSSFLFSEEDETISTLFSQQKDSVFLVNQSIFIDENKVKKKDLFLKLEQALDKKVLNQYIPLASGTAFCINEDGYLITAAHVLKKLSSDEKFEWAQWNFLQLLAKNMIPGILSESELTTVCFEFYRLAREEPIVISVKSTSKIEYRAEIIDENTGLDLALLKIECEDKIKPFIIDEATGYKEGDSVYTIGYPLPFLIDKFLDDFKPTLTDGIISAIRDDDWDIQHTASISPGNSGGPLLRKDGKLIGINVGKIERGSDLYFSIESDKLIKWLQDIGKSELINE